MNSIKRNLVVPLLAMLLMMSLGGSPATQPSGSAPPTGTEVGQTAPEIVGKDINGKAMKLSDFRGKIVVIDFFGDW